MIGASYHVLAAAELWSTKPSTHHHGCFLGASLYDIINGSCCMKKKSDQRSSCTWIWMPNLNIERILLSLQKELVIVKVFQAWVCYTISAKVESEDQLIISRRFWEFLLSLHFLVGGLTLIGVFWKFWYFFLWIFANIWWLLSLLKWNPLNFDNF